MSGLLGLVDLSGAPIQPELLRSLAEAAAYRAPGGITFQLLEGAGLAHFALHTADRPLLSSRISVLFDGRLDNRPELIGRLAPAKGADSLDAELVLAAYHEWGDACPEHLLGDFAFAVWDTPRRRLLCAVDPLGIKPLHWAYTGSGLCFASDAVMVFGHPEVPADFNEMEIAAYLAGQCESPTQSFFAAVHRLPPGHFLVAEEGEVRLEHYWSPRLTEIRYARDEDYADRFREIFERAVTDRLRTGGSSAGVAMSGGLDSTSVAAMACRGNRDLRAYTFAFNRLSECDERSYSRLMTEELGLIVEAIEAESLWDLEALAPLPHSPDTPFVGWRTCYQEILRRMQARGSRVLLMGHGGDDLLRGNSRVYSERLWRGDLSALGEVRAFSQHHNVLLLRALYNYFVRPHLPVDAYHSWRGKGTAVLPPWTDRGFRQRNRLEKRGESLRARKIFTRRSRQEMYSDLTATPPYWRLANWHDRNAASFGVEVRHPFLDRELVEYLLAIPGEQIFRLDGYKSLLRRSMTDIIPDRIRLRPDKTGFVPFLSLMLRERAANEVTELLRSPTSVDLGIFNERALRSAFSEFRFKNAALLRPLWYSVSLEIWLRRCHVFRVRPSSLASVAAA